MAAANYLATRAEYEEFRLAEAVERRHIETVPEGEREEGREILRGFGLMGELLDQAAVVITADRDRWVRLMLRNEYGLPAAVRSPSRAAASTFSAFLICGLIPLLPFETGLSSPFCIAAAVTSLMFFLIGALKNRWSVERWWHSSAAALLIGGGAAAVAYIIGDWLRRL